jgi:hypothetical protein
MGERKHTVGPWRIFRSTDGQKIIGIGELNGAGVTDCGFGTWRDGAEQEANARLIAAAPELLEALDWLLACAPGDFPTDGDDSERYGLARAGARKAILKATGGQP